MSHACSTWLVSSLNFGGQCNWCDPQRKLWGTCPPVPRGIYTPAKDPTNSIKVLKELIQITEKHNNRAHVTKNTANPPVYTNMDGSHRGQVRHAWMPVGLPPRTNSHQYYWHLTGHFYKNEKKEETKSEKNEWAWEVCGHVSLFLFLCEVLVICLVQNGVSVHCVYACVYARSERPWRHRPRRSSSRARADASRQEHCDVWSSTVEGALSTTHVTERSVSRPIC